MYSEEEQKESLLLSLRVEQRVSTAQSFSFFQEWETLASSLGGSGTADRVTARTNDNRGWKQMNGGLRKDGMALYK